MGSSYIYISQILLDPALSGDSILARFVREDHVNMTDREINDVITEKYDILWDHFMQEGACLPQQLPI